MMRKLWMTLKKLSKNSLTRNHLRSRRRGRNGSRIWYNNNLIWGLKKRGRGWKVARVGTLTLKRNSCTGEARGHPMNNQLMTQDSTSDHTLAVQTINSCSLEAKRGWNQPNTLKRTWLKSAKMETRAKPQKHHKEKKVSTFLSQARKTWQNNNL